MAVNAENSARGEQKLVSPGWWLNLVAALREMPQARWQCLNFSGTGQRL